MIAPPQWFRDIHAPGQRLWRNPRRTAKATASSTPQYVASPGPRAAPCATRTSGSARQPGARMEIAASVEDLNAWSAQPHTVAILENKETGYAITDDHPCTTVLHGHGFSVVNYARITWARHAQSLIYWGDIDAPGLQFVNDLRSLGLEGGPLRASPRRTAAWRTWRARPRTSSHRAARSGRVRTTTSAAVRPCMVR